ncbi:MAG: Rne/Rng family ribonuclease, partial [Kordiimonas sp.]
MSTRMLVDARHPEETRVTVVKGSRVEDFDYESTTRRQLKGNIYLARVTRVEPSLQAAFVEYGGNRHGFLAFSEIHPDYYQIPVEDREALIEEETQVAAAEKAAEDAEEEENSKKRKPRRRRGRRSAAEKAAETDAVISEEADTESEKTEETGDAQPADEIKTDDAADQTNDDSSTQDASEAADQSSEASDEDASNDEASEDDDAEVKESDEEDKEAEIEAAAASRRRNLRALKRKYSIQEVIKRRQVLLIQVVKEERGNKGAALTTYLSLAGRYCVLMPNSTHSGGISRKISNVSDRKKLKQIIGALNVSSDMGLIVRTAGINRTKTEIKRDYDYLLRLWNGIRDLTLKSTAPALIYEEGNLIKRTIRDVYTRDIDEIWVEGERGYRAAKDFMKLLMPSHAKKVQNYKDRIPLYHRYQVENQLEAMYQPVVQLKSGGYIVINPTEALISIDVNSGRATKEHNIEETAVKTNLEAAEEVARQLRLRDMAGLVVIDFIDMEERGNNRAVERRMKEVLKSDRARIQVGRISSFGLMEMSRQRLRPNLLEVAMETCPHCAGTGLVRSVESASIMALRLLEEEGIRNRSSIVRVSACPDVAIYLLNQKRAVLSELESEYGLSIQVLADSNLGPSDVELTREAGGDTKGTAPQPEPVVKMDSAAPIIEDTEETTPSGERDDQPRKKRRRRRRRRRGSGGEEGEPQPQAQTKSE